MHKILSILTIICVLLGCFAVPISVNAQTNILSVDFNDKNIKYVDKYVETSSPSKLLKEATDSSYSLYSYTYNNAGPIGKITDKDGNTDNYALQFYASSSWQTWNSQGGWVINDGTTVATVTDGKSYRLTFDVIVDGPVWKLATVTTYENVNDNGIYADKAESKNDYNFKNEKYVAGTKYYYHNGSSYVECDEATYSSHYATDANTKKVVTAVNDNRSDFTLKAAYAPKFEGKNRISSFNNPLNETGIEVPCDSESYYYYDKGVKKSAEFGQWYTVTTEFTAHLPEAGGNIPMPSLFGLNCYYVPSPTVHIDNVVFSEIDAIAENSTLTLYNGETVVQTVENIYGGSALPELPILNSKNGKYFVGWSTTDNGENLILDGILPNKVNSLYAVFMEYPVDVTDTFQNTNSKIVFPNNVDSQFSGQIDRMGWVMQRFTTDGYIEAYAHDVWGVRGAALVADDSGYAAALEPFCKYRLTVTYMASELETTATISAGYGFPQSAAPDLKDSYFSTKADETVTIDTVSGDWQTFTYEFTTDSLTGVMPVVGAYVTSSGRQNGGYNKVLIKSMQLERLAKIKGFVNIELGGGCLDFDMTDKSTQISFDGETALPKTAYRYNHAFSGWYMDSTLTVPAVGNMSDGETYYAAWVEYGDINNDKEIDTSDLSTIKLNLAGTGVNISNGSDLNDDKVIDTVDLSSLKLKLAGYDVVFGPTRYISLTFDDGPNEYFTPIIDSFNKVNGKATFFVTGYFSTEDTKQYLITAIENGFELGNHSYSHGNLAELDDEDDIKNQIVSANKKVKDLTGYDMKLMRLPFFGINESVKKVTKELGMPLIGTSYTVGESDQPAETVKNNIINSAFNGTILCLHSAEKTAGILDDLLADLTAKGYKFVTVSEMLEVMHYDNIPLGTQINRAEKQKKLLALTFDDGPNENLVKFSDRLAEYDGHCTFFLIGNKINDSTKPFLQYAIDSGNELANHTAEHKNIPNYTTAEEIAADFSVVDNKLNDMFGIKTACVRLPGNAGSDFVYKTAAEHGYPIIRFSNAYNDWDGTPTTAAGISEFIINAATDGGILNLHVTDKTCDALLTALPALADEYDFVTISEMFRLKGYSNLPLGEPIKEAVQQNVTATYNLNDEAVLNNVVLNTRYDVTEKGVTFDYTGSTLRFKAELGGEVELKMNLQATHHAGQLQDVYFYVYIDGICRPTRYAATPDQSGDYTLKFNVGNENKLREIEIARSSERERGTVDLISLSINGTLMKAEERELMVEIIGDSVTCGGAIGGPYGHDGVQAYAFKTVKALNTDWRIVSNSGYGMKYSSSGNTGPQGEWMSSYGLENYMRDTATPYTHTRNADIVLINLGTNDYNAKYQGTAPWTNEEWAGYAKEFVATVKQYNPKAKIVWVIGGIISSYGDAAEMAMTALGGEEAGYYACRIEGTFHGGLDNWHPGVEDHKEMSEQLKEFLIEKGLV